MTDELDSPWMRKALDEVEGERADAGLPPLPAVRPKPSITRAVLERKEEHTIVLPDGRRCRLIRELRFEIDGGADLRTHYIYKGPKQLGIQLSKEFTSMGWLNHLTLGYPNHQPTLDDIIAVRTGFFGDRPYMWVVPTAAELEANPDWRFLVSLTEMPVAWTTNPIARPD